MRRERMSRPSSSVPHQCIGEGGDKRVGGSRCAGSWGAIQGANKAKTTKIAINIAPIVARGFRRVASRNEIVAVDMLIKPEQLTTSSSICSLHATWREWRFGSAFYVSLSD